VLVSREHGDAGRPWRDQRPAPQMNPGRGRMRQPVLVAARSELDLAVNGGCARSGEVVDIALTGMCEHANDHVHLAPGPADRSRQLSSPRRTDGSVREFVKPKLKSPDGTIHADQRTHGRDNHRGDLKITQVNLASDITWPGAPERDPTKNIPGASPLLPTYSCGAQSRGRTAPPSHSHSGIKQSLTKVPTVRVTMGGSGVGPNRPGGETRVRGFVLSNGTSSAPAEFILEHARRPHRGMEPDDRHPHHGDNTENKATVEGAVNRRPRSPK